MQGGGQLLKQGVSWLSQYECVLMLCSLYGNQIKLQTFKVRIFSQDEAVFAHTNFSCQEFNDKTQLWSRSAEDDDFVLGYNQEIITFTLGSCVCIRAFVFVYVMYVRVVPAENDRCVEREELEGWGAVNSETCM